MTAAKEATRGAHLWGGEWREGDEHVAPPAPRAATRSWSYPSAGTDEWRAALDALEAGAAERRGPIPGRLRRVRAVARELETQTLAAVEVGAFLGLEPDEWRAHRAGWRERLEAAWREREWTDRAPGLVVIAAHWTDGVPGLIARVAEAWVEGARVAIASDARLPQAAELVARAWNERGAEARADLAVLHGVPTEGLTDAARRGSCRRFEIAGNDRELKSERLRPLVELDAVAAREIRNAEVRVGVGDDLEACASDVVARAFGRVETLGGQLGGQLARVHGDERIFSRLTEAVLGALESTEPRALVPCIDRAAAHDHREACHRGLDQGATLVSGGAEHFGGSSEGSADRPVVTPALLTNVEADMDLARWRRPTAVLSLLRATS